MINTKLVHHEEWVFDSSLKLRALRVFVVEHYLGGDVTTSQIVEGLQRESAAKSRMGDGRPIGFGHG